MKALRKWHVPQWGKKSTLLNWNVSMWELIRNVFASPLKQECLNPLDSFELDTKVTCIGRLPVVTELNLLFMESSLMD